MEKDSLTRFGVSMPDELARQFDQYLSRQGYSNRSEAIRDLVRKELLAHAGQDGDQTVAGTIVTVYDHDVRDLPLILVDLQHDYHHEIISNLHVHLNHDQCLEVIVVRGRMSRLRELHKAIQTQKGVAYAELSVTYAESDDRHPAGGHVHGLSH